MTSTLPPLVQAFSGAIGSTMANALTYPLDLATIRLQVQSPNNLSRRTGVVHGFRVLHRIIKMHGISALYDGLSTDSFAKLLSNFFYFYIYSWLRWLATRRLLFVPPSKARRISARKATRNPGIAQEILLGFLAGVGSRAITMPLNIITLRLQTERDDSERDEEDRGTRSKRATNIISVVKIIYKENGLAGFWKGFKTAIILSLNPSISMAIFQLFRRFLTVFNKPALDTQHNSRAIAKLGTESISKTKEVALVNPSPTEAFLGGAFSSAIAVSLLYPLILAKNRLQTSSAETLREALMDAYKGKHKMPRKEVLPRGESSKAAKSSVRGLYQGFEMQILKGFLNEGVTLLVKGRIERLIVAVYLRNFAIAEITHRTSPSHG